MEPIILSRAEGVATLTIARPEQSNALNTATLLCLERQLDLLARQGEARCLIITGQGERAFAAGADTRELEGLDAEGARAFFQLGSRVFLKVQEFYAPVIAAVNGYALGGGCELALACDIRIAAENAVFALPETGIGIMPGWGGTQRLPRLVGYGHAAHMIFAGHRLAAADALAIGLVCQVHPGPALGEAALALAGQIARNAPLGVRGAKAAMQAAHTMSLADGLALEGDTVFRVFQSADAAAGLQALNQKRPRVFAGK